MKIKIKVLDAYRLRCAVTAGECANLHLDACRSRLPGGACTQDEILDICAEEVYTYTKCMPVVNFDSLSACVRTHLTRSSCACVSASPR